MFTKVLLLSLIIASALAFSREGATRVESGSHIFNDGSKLTIKAPNGTVSLIELPAGKAHNKRDSGWIASVWTFFNYSYYSAEWKVPPIPATSTNNIIFFFNSFESSAYNDILQPVLQLNNGVGGWTMASWYGAGSKYVESTPAPVSPGDTITGVINLSGNTWQILSYVNGALKASLSVSYSTISAQGNAEFAMEVYNINTCSMYPSTNRLDVTNINLKAGQTQVTPKFSTSINSNDCNAGASYTTTTAAITWKS